MYISLSGWCHPFDISSPDEPGGAVRLPDGSGCQCKHTRQPGKVPLNSAPSSILIKISWNHWQMDWQSVRPYWGRFGHETVSSAEIEPKKNPFRIILTAVRWWRSGLARKCWRSGVDLAKKQVKTRGRDWQLSVWLWMFLWRRWCENTLSFQAF